MDEIWWGDIAFIFPINSNCWMSHGTMYFDNSLVLENGMMNLHMNGIQTQSDLLGYILAYTVYFIIKLCIYALWCRAGIAIFKLSFDSSRSKFQLAVFFGFIRTMLGVIFGLGFYYLEGGFQSRSIGAVFMPELTELPFLLVILVMVRFVEWYLMLIIMCKLARTSSARYTLLWIDFGIILSFIADILGFFFGTIAGYTLWQKARMC